MRTALEQELGLAAYFVSSDAPLEKGAKSEALESDGEKLSSTDEDEETGMEGEGAWPDPGVLKSSSAGFCLSPLFCHSGVGRWGVLPVLLRTGILEE